MKVKLYNQLILILTTIFLESYVNVNNKSILDKLCEKLNKIDGIEKIFRE